jgi:protease I
MKKILMVIAPHNFRDEEFLRPKEVFEKNEAQVTIASKEVSEAPGMLGAKAKVDIDISQVKVADYDALVFIGGTGASVYFDDETVLSLVKAADEQGKVIGAICISPSILANAGILKDKRVTSWPSEQINLENQGAVYTGANVEVDGQIVTAKGPEAAVVYGEKIVELLK